ncbi:unnamed protein product, partial [Porites lobata]
MTTRARHEKMNTLYTAKPVFLESFGCKQWTFLVSQDKNTPNVNTIPFKQQINITQVIRELQLGNLKKLTILILLLRVVMVMFIGADEDDGDGSDDDEDDDDDDDDDGDDDDDDEDDD